VVIGVAHVNRAKNKSLSPHADCLRPLNLDRNSPLNDGRENINNEERATARREERDLSY
jgi:hypothetical protein